MVTAVLKIQIYLFGVTSLKQKRSIVKSLVSRLRNRFNVSASEVGHQDSKTSAVIAIALVCNENQFAQSQLDKILDFARRDGRFTLGSVDREVF